MHPQILRISGSQIKNSNSDRLVPAVLDGSDLSSEFVKLSKINICPCVACLGCKTDNLCQVKDDYPVLAKKFSKATVVVGVYSSYGVGDGFTNAFWIKN